ncbi:unnamed protein product [Cunninghamella echinulata]
MSKSKPSNQNTNKDLSCLRCRKKKAKCSKTRPTCTQCEQFNHPCEYPDAPPNLTDLSKKVLDLYDSLKDLEGEFLFKYMQTSTTEDEENNEEDDDDKDIEPTTATIYNSNSNNNDFSQSPLLPLSTTPSTPFTDLNTLELLNNDNNNIPSPSSLLLKEVAWSMSYLPDGISIHATAHNILDFMQFIDKFTRQCINDFGSDSLSTYWDLDYHQDLIMELLNQDDDEEEKDNHFIKVDNDDNKKVMNQEQMDGMNKEQQQQLEEEEEEDDFNEDYYLVTIPIFTTSQFLHDSDQQQQRKTPIHKNSSNKNYVSAHSTLDFQQLYHILPSFLHYVHLKLDQYTKTNMTPGVPYQILLIIEELKSYLIIQNNNNDNDKNNNKLIDPLSMVYILSTYLICKKICTFKKKDNDNDDIPLPSSWTDADLYYHIKLMLIDIVLQITPTYAACLSVLLLIWYNALQEDQKEMDQHLIDLAWHMFKNLMHYPLTTVENQIISASLIYLDVYATTFRYYHTSISFSSHFIQELGIQFTCRIRLLCQAIHTTLNNDDNNDDDLTLYKQQQFVLTILESQLMLFLQQILELFYLKDDQNNNDDDKKVNKKDTIVRKVDVDDVLTLVRDLEQWEQQLPSWATSTSTVKNKKIKKEQQEQDRVTNMTLQLHLTLHFIKLLLFRPFCTEFKDYGMEQTHTKTTFLDLSLHSADTISNYLILLEEKKQANVKENHPPLPYSYPFQFKQWVFALHQMVLDVIDRVRHTFNSDHDILLQLDAIVNKIESI